MVSGFVLREFIMHSFDWLVVGVYLLGMFALAIWCARGQSSGKDYYLAGNSLSPLSLATSTIATQCSTNSLLGAPAFVGFVAGGGMLWLQYELAVPLAMLALAYLLLPIRKSGYVSVYEFLEERLGRRARLLASLSFLLFRGIATGVTVYGVALVLVILLDVSYTTAVFALMGVTIAYDLLGGLKAVVVSDVVQMVLIILAVILGLAFLMVDAGDAPVFDLTRAQTISFDPGLTSGNTYGVWPMLIGGFFLYCAYYGCDQSQAQRLLASRSTKDTGRVLFFNGVLRFPVVLLYCLLGLALAAYALRDPTFIQSLPLSANGTPNINLVFPVYVLERFPVGVTGLVMVGIFAAAMSSIDSALNSLSAATLQDFTPLVTGSKEMSERRTLRLGRLLTLLWGLFAVVFSYQVESIAPTVLEAINKIGSFANGPLLALFTIALVSPSIGQRGAIIGFFTGLIANAFVSLALPDVSWLWWNPIGFFIAFATAASAARLGGSRGEVTIVLPNVPEARSLTSPLILAFFVILAVCIVLGSQSV